MSHREKKHSRKPSSGGSGGSGGSGSRSFRNKTQRSMRTSVRTVGNYKIGERLGKGAFGSVYKGLNVETGDFAAIKQLDLEDVPEEEKKNIFSELDLLAKLDHPNIVKMLDSVQTEDSLFIVLEFVENGSLLTILKRFGTVPEALIARYVRQLLIGLSYLHDRGVVHRDIKCDNLLITKNGKIKLADFGIAIHKKAESAAGSGDEQTGPLGSPYWMAPEIIELEDPTPKADIWSVGCTIIELLTGNPPFYELSKMQAMFAMVNEPHPPFPKHPSPSPHILDVLKLCFQRDPAKRPSAQELLKHPFIPQDIDDDDDLLKSHKQMARSETVANLESFLEMEQEMLKNSEAAIQLRSNIDKKLGELKQLRDRESQFAEAIAVARARLAKAEESLRQVQLDVVTKSGECKTLCRDLAQLTGEGGEELLHKLEETLKSSARPKPVQHLAVKTFEKSSSSEELLTREVHSARPERRDVKKAKDSTKRFSSERKKKKKYPTLKTSG
eukprot:CAMPEP_0174230878 /NCGR_PEP_ID=MMETSP0417-20130205/1537_1 /TAXON_ID=242541 /ORGANISM="Mayorella sp, Strain BSH-02190019" /LENGTH=498 /DNA_ID=CAMNT_0015308647 /DNA_START=101 /DNA_END=1594 /DNA_ORIENTATION=-